VHRRTGRGTRLGVLIVADPRVFRRALAEVGQVLGRDSAASVLGGIAFEPRSAELLRGEWGGRLDKSLLIRTARDAAGQLAGQPAVAAASARGEAPGRRPAPGPAPRPAPGPARRPAPRPARHAAGRAGPAGPLADLPAAEPGGR
jgi:hypothetical protein